MLEVLVISGFNDTNEQFLVPDRAFGEILSHYEILAILARRPQSELNVVENFSEISRSNLENLINKGKIITQNVARVLFYKLKI